MNPKDGKIDTTLKWNIEGFTAATQILTPAVVKKSWFWKKVIT